jgi:hypothetical protein
MVAGNGSAMVYAQPTRPRHARWTLGRLRRGEAFGSTRDIVQALLAERAVGLVAGETETAGEVAVLSADGEARIRRDNGSIVYAPRSGDPLRVGGPFQGSPRDWLAESWHAPFPDAAYQLLDQFRSPRTGDMVVVANEGYDFRRRFEIPEHRAGHGSLVRAHMHTPLWSNRPMPAVPLRTVDVFPTVLHWLGVRVPDGIDGELVWEA